jgi:hypothetical protein
VNARFQANLHHNELIELSDARNRNDDGRNDATAPLTKAIERRMGNAGRPGRSVGKGSSCAPRGVATGVRRPWRTRHDVVGTGIARANSVAMFAASAAMTTRRHRPSQYVIPPINAMSPTERPPTCEHDLRYPAAGCARHSTFGNRRPGGTFAVASRVNR